MNIELDSNSMFDAIELVTRNPWSRTVGALAAELKASLTGVDRIAASQAFAAFLKKRLAKNGEKSTAAELAKALVALRKGAKKDRPVSLMFEHGSDVVDANCYRSPCLHAVYTGSLHVNVTLPHVVGEDSSTGSAFDSRHRRAAATLQWLEPLLVVVLGSPHPLHSIDPAVFPALSYRMTSESLTAIATNDVQADGINGARVIPRWDFGRSAHNSPLADKLADSQRRKDARLRSPNKAPDSVWMRAMLQSRNSAARAFVTKAYEWCPCVPSLGSDFRHDTDYRSAPFGFEFRTMDRVPSDCLEPLLRLIWYSFDASAAPRAGSKSRARTIPSAAKSKSFVKFLEAAAVKGSAARLTTEYCAALKRALGLPESGMPSPRQTAHEALNSISEALFDEFGGGKGAYSRFVDFDEYGGRYESAPAFPDLNRLAMEYHAKENVRLVAAKRKPPADADGAGRGDSLAMGDARKGTPAPRTLTSPR
jgi:hypothetical protein